MIRGRIDNHYKRLIVGLGLFSLALAGSRSPRNRAIWGMIAFVAATTALDMLTARGLDGDTGTPLPVREPALA
ncbi:hypothetical protein [Sphingomonas sp. NPDC079357]|uniref:hypothetical protein n=1 Tax=Sphingomonas sp. NPDC079357 TaxID=3364518 RepID=UPI00384D3101